MGLNEWNEEIIRNCLTFGVSKIPTFSPVGPVMGPDNFIPECSSKDTRKWGRSLRKLY